MKKKPTKKPAAKKAMKSVNPFANAKKGQNPFAKKGGC
jgi:hypothetical protein